uniref:Retrotransposon Copia-like N-terminal domain-containing protein n=1 Tax=Oryza brachyantha TaxID=4533 RepID=J3KVQ8_ORYBR
MTTPQPTTNGDDASSATPLSVQDATVNLVTALAAAHAVAAAGEGDANDALLVALVQAHAALITTSSSTALPSDGTGTSSSPSSTVVVAPPPGAMVLVAGMPSPPPVHDAVVPPVLSPTTASALSVPSVKTHVPVVLDMKSSNYTRWRTFLVAFIGKFGLLGHILEPSPPVDAVGTWAQEDFAVLTALYCSISTDVLDIVMEPSHSARELSVAAEGVFRDNRKTRIIYQETEFRSLQQGDMTVTDYCRRLKGLADSLRDLGEPITDRTLVLNLIRGLSPRFATQADLLPLQVSFPSFANARSALLLAEIVSKLRRNSYAREQVLCC